MDASVQSEQINQATFLQQTNSNAKNKIPKTQHEWSTFMHEIFLYKPIKFTKLGKQMRKNAEHR